MSLGPSSSQFCVDDVTKLSQNFKILRERFHKRMILQNNSYIWFWSFCQYWYMKYKFGNFLTQFWVNVVQKEVKTAIFWESDLRDKLLTLKFHQILISVFLSPMKHDIELGIFLTNLEIMTSQKINIPEFWTIN